VSARIAQALGERKGSVEVLTLRSMRNRL
jgi:hypothetical protein